MGWILFGLIILFVIRRSVGSTGNGQDEFAGSSIKSYFFLEKFIDEPSESEDIFDQNEILYEDDQINWFEEGM